MGDKGQKIYVNFSETASLQRYTASCIVWLQEVGYFVCENKVHALTNEACQLAVRIGNTRTCRGFALYISRQLHAFEGNSVLVSSLSLGSTDFFDILPMNVEVEEGFEFATIELRTRNDDITLEYDDTVILVFTPDEDDLIEFYEGEGEYIRDRVVVYIDDNDRK